MKMKIFVFVITLSLLLSGMLVAVGGEATDRGEDEKTEEQFLEDGLIDTAIEDNNGDVNDVKNQDTSTSSELIEISDVHELQNMNEDLDADYVLTDHIYASETEEWNWNGTAYEGFEPIGNGSSSFTGTLYGNGNEIKELYINRINSDYIGLFGSIGENGTVNDVGVVDIDVSGHSSVGGLTGRNAGKVSSSYTTGYVNGNVKDGWAVGGLVGHNRGRVIHSHSTANVIGQQYVGGLVGGSNPEGEVRISASFATGNVEGDFGVGGLVGTNGGTIKNTYSTGPVKGDDDSVGGLVGEHGWGDTIKWSYSTSDVMTEDESVSQGELVGRVNIYGDAETSYVIDSLAEEGPYDVIGSNDGQLVGRVNESKDMADIGLYTQQDFKDYPYLHEPWDMAKIDQWDGETWYIEDGVGLPRLGVPPTPETKVLDIYVEGRGITSPSPGTYHHDSGEEVTISAYSDYGWTFKNWEGDVPGGIEKDETITVEMDKNRSLTANFVRDEFDLDIGVEGEGNTDPSPGIHSFEYEEEVALSAFPDEKWNFEYWTGDVGSTQKEITIEMTENKEITANFEEEEVKTYNLTINIEGEGDVQIEPNQDEYEEGTDVTLTADSDDGWYFDMWTGDHGSSEKEITITMDTDMEITANFEEEEGEESDGGGAPGFTTMILLMSVVMTVAIYRKKKR